MRGTPTTFYRRNLAFGLAEIAARLPLVLTAGYLARAVGPEVYGSWALVLVFQTLLGNLAGLGLSSSLSRLASVCSEGRARGYLAVALAASAGALAAGGVVIVIARPWLAAGLGVSAAMSWLLWPGLLIGAASTMEGLLDAYFKAREKIIRQVAFLLARTLAEITVIAAVFLWRLGPAPHEPSRLLAAYAVGLVGLKACLYGPLVLARERPMEPAPASERRAFLRYGVPMIPAVLVMWLAGQNDRLILAHLVDGKALGVYAFGASLAGYVAYAGYAVYPLLLPRASRLFDSGDRAGLRRLFADAQYVLLAVLTGTLGVITLFAPDIVALTAGPEYLGASATFTVLAAAVALEQFLGLYQYVLHLARRPDLVLRLNVLYAALSALAVWLAARAGGGAAVPWAILAAVLIANVLRYRVARRRVDLALPGGVVAGVGAGTVVLVCAALITRTGAVGIRLGVAVLIVVGSLAGLLMARGARSPMWPWLHARVPRP